MAPHGVGMLGVVSVVLAAFAGAPCAHGARLDLGKLAQKDALFKETAATSKWFLGKLREKYGKVAEVGHASGSTSQQVVRSRAAFRSIICPFLSVLVREGVLPIKESYHEDELELVSRQSGLTDDIAKAHMDSNFRNNPSKRQDIFDMEGASNEHKSSTGIADCATVFSNCSSVAGGLSACEATTPNKRCGVPSPALFEEFWKIVDANVDGVMTHAEIELATEHPDGFKGFIRDRNPIGLGTVRASYLVILVAFAPAQGNGIDKATLGRILVERNFPIGYTFPRRNVTT